MRKLKIKGIVIVSALSIILTGCSPKVKENLSNQTEYKDTIIEEVEDTSKEEYPQEETIEEKEETIVETNPKDSLDTLKDFHYFRTAKEQIIELMSSEEYEKMKEKGKEYIITAIDFVFFDEPVNGRYYSEFTDELKKSMLRDIADIDEIITTYYPDYKESFSEKYQVASSFISDKYFKILDIIKEYLGEENYQAITDIKNQIKGDLKENFEEGKEFLEDKTEKTLTLIKDKYQGWKNK